MSYQCDADTPGGGIEMLYLKSVPIFAASIFAVTQTLWMAFVQLTPGIADTHTILGVISIVNSVLSIGVVMGAISLAYGYGKLNERVQLQGKALAKQDERIERIYDHLRFQTQRAEREDDAE